MQTLTAFAALWQGIRDPRHLERPIASTAVAIFAAAVMVWTLAATATVYIEHGNAALRAETEQLNVLGPQQMGAGASVDTEAANRQFTAVLGGALIRSVVTLAAMALMFFALTRFLTDRPIPYSASLAAVSATAGIEVLRSLVSLAPHLLFETSRAGFHLGAVLQPLDHPFLFVWLQRIDIFNVWHYIAAAMALATWSDLHYRYGWVIGGVVFLVVQILMGGLTLVAWILAQGV